ncbi:MAG: glycosyltransferase [wastewater metagenome]|nr:glycosyltransferase [Candidatus Loosdrechtia aerotolerans]
MIFPCVVYFLMYQGLGYIIMSKNIFKKIMREKHPRVSIGLPVYNGGKFLKETLDSILIQTFQDFELIISDNASVDDTREICHAYMMKDRRIRYYRNESNRGASWNYNYVFQLSVGEYFKWAASDDIFAPEYLHLCVDILDKDPQVVVCYSKTKIINEHGIIISDYYDGLNLQDETPIKRFIKLIRSIRMCNAVFGLMRANVLRKTPLIGNYISSDSCLMAELSLYGKFFEIPEKLFFRRLHPGASSYDKSTERQLEFFDPRNKKKIVMPWCRRRYENFVSVKRSQIKLQEKMFLFGFLMLKTLHWYKLYTGEILLATKQFLLKYHKNT